MENNPGIKNIKNMYSNLTYFDQYGHSLILLTLITLIVVIICTYCYIMVNMQPIKNDWINQRCKPYVVPFAGLINKPDNMSVNEFTQKNFAYCTQDIIKNMTGYMVEPLTFVIKQLSSTVNSLGGSINGIRGMINKIRTFFETVSKEIMGRLMNIMIPLQQIIISFKDMMAKIQGTMTAALFTVLGSYYTLKSLLGAIAEFILKILIALAAIIFVLWLMPFTWGTAAAMTALFVAVSIPLALMLAFMSDVLHIKASRGIPGLKKPSLKCFDKDTMISMNDGTKKSIKAINVGDKLKDNNEVTAKFVVTTEGSIMYDLNNVIVSDTHIVKYNNKWIPVCKHPMSKKLASYKEPYLYCLNTSSKKIIINNIEFTDWDEIYDGDVEKIKKNYFNKYRKNLVIQDTDIHSYFDGGFLGSTPIQMNEHEEKQIKDICIGDFLKDNVQVYGIVEIYGKDICNQYEYNLGKEKIKGGPNLNLCDKTVGFMTTLNLDENNKKIIKNEEKLYHLLTHQKYFYVKNIRFYDYNATIDLFLEN